MTLWTILCVSTKPLAGARIFFCTLVPCLHEFAQKRTMIGVVTTAKAELVAFPTPNDGHSLGCRASVITGRAEQSLGTACVGTKA